MIRVVCRKNAGIFVLVKVVSHHLQIVLNVLILHNLKMETATGVDEIIPDMLKAIEIT